MKYKLTVEIKTEEDPSVLLEKLQELAVEHGEYTVWIDRLTDETECAEDVE